MQTIQNKKYAPDVQHVQRNYILFISSYPPRECGIATYTQDLAQAFDKKKNPSVYTKVCALNELPTSMYRYDGKVSKQITATDIENYVDLAKTINKHNDFKIVNIQHEFGIFGGQWGDYLLPFLQVIEKPVITTFHSVLGNPNDHLKKVVRFICAKSSAVVVMNEISQQILNKEYRVSSAKIFLIPHGIPQVAYESTKIAKKELGLESKTILSTFGLINANKGIEYAIRALPEVIERYPNILYLVIGETHPMVRKHQGESYRNFLTEEIEKLGLKNYVKFYNKYVTLDEITTFLRATDIYLAPMLDRNQSVSGTLAYALGCCCPVISTPTQYAKYIVNKDNGVLIKFKNIPDISHALIRLLSEEKLMKSMSINAYESTRPMIWPNVVEKYNKVYERFTGLKIKEDKLPKIKLDHLKRLTDNFGMLQHARYSRPQKRFGYTVDDNARALIAFTKVNKQSPDLRHIGLMERYLNFLKFNQKKNGTFARLVTAQRKRDNTHEEDVLGRAIWALGFFLSLDGSESNLIKLALNMFNKSVCRLYSIKSPRAIAFAITGLYYYTKSRPDKRLIKLLKQLTDKQLELYSRSSTNGWQWFEDRLTYSNSKLPESLYYAYNILKNKKYLAVANKSLSFLRNITFEQKHYSPIGQAGWFIKNKKRAYFDQQPEDTASMVETNVAAYLITRRKQHAEDAYTAFQWFLGRNALGLMVYDEKTGGCYDGLRQHTLNLNQGAESTVSYLLARLAIEDVADVLNLKQP